ncbi:MAG: nuclear transport factor 2 family protein, partial [Aridibacter sp.]
MQRRIMLISAILIVTSLSIFGQITDKQSNKMDKSEQAILALANDYANAVAKQDAAAMQRLLTDNYLQVFSPRGTVVTKAEVVNGYKNPTPSNVDSL